MRARYNWTQIRNTCPEFIPTEWDVVLAIIAAIGFLMSWALVYRFRTQLKGSVFLFSLAIIDLMCCLHYEYNYFLKSVAIFYRSDFMADFRTHAMGQVKMIEEFGNIFIPLLVFLIVLEKFLWTCSSRTRETWRYLTVDSNKYMVTVLTALYGMAAAVVMNWNLLLANAHFCDVLLLPLPFKQPFFRFLQTVLIPLVSFLLAPTTFVLALVTLCRISRVGEGEKPANQEEIMLANIGSDNPKLTTGKVKRSILCMLAVYFLFMVRGFCWFVYMNPRTATISHEIRNSRIMRSWSYDFMNVVFSGSRMILYYVFCRKDLVVDYPPRALGV